jgi:HAD superfamily hydrolase (TIGR01509 family)
MHLAALFDMDGLLIDSERSIMTAWLRAAQDLGASLSETEYLAVVGHSAPKSDSILIEVFGDHSRFELARAAVLRTLEVRHASNGFALKPGVKALLTALSERKIPCAVASSSPKLEIERRLNAAGILRHFSSVAGGDEVLKGKPDPAVYLLAAHRLGVSANQCLAFEDSPNGAHAALAAGASLAIVPDLIAPTEELAVQSLGILGSLEEALPQVEHWFTTAKTPNCNRTRPPSAAGE